MGADGAAFRGADRRADPALARVGPQLSYGVVLAICGFVAIAVLPALSVVFPAEIPTSGWPISALAAVAGIASTVAWVSAWAVSGRTWPAYLGIAVAPAWATAELAATPAGAAAHRAALILVGVLTGGAVFIASALGVRAPQVDTTLRPGRMLSLVLGGFALVVGVGVYALRLPVVVDPPSGIVVAAGVLAAACWLAAGATCLRRTDANHVERVGLAVAMSALGLGSIDRSVGALDVSARAFDSWAMTAGRTVAFVGWLVLLLTAVRSLADARKVARRRQQSLRDARDEIVRGLRQQQLRIEERRHDLRSLIAGIQGATATLTQYREFLDTHEQQLLESALLAEISRLQRSIGAVTTRRAFSLAAAIEPVLISERAQGARIEADLEDVDVVGDADATAALVQNLLTNARRHAPGAAVRLTTVRVDDHVVVAVADDGPGLPVPVGERVRALFDGRSMNDGATIRGAIESFGHAVVPLHGLGLAICARLAKEEGARLRVADVPRGTRIELELPLARATLRALQPSAVG